MPRQLVDDSAFRSYLVVEWGHFGGQNVLTPRHQSEREWGLEPDVCWLARTQPGGVGLTGFGGLVRLFTINSLLSVSRPSRLRWHSDLAVSRVVRNVASFRTRFD